METAALKAKILGGRQWWKLTPAAFVAWKRQMHRRGIKLRSRSSQVTRQPNCAARTHSRPRSRHVRRTARSSVSSGDSSPGEPPGPADLNPGGDAGAYRAVRTQAGRT